VRYSKDQDQFKIGVIVSLIVLMQGIPDNSIVLKRDVNTLLYTALEKDP